ncbi:uncharacterized protein [Dermacentor albipictus]|uniref:uncharacterized protein isoform X1 n=2 Tax=Dermacentor albipictus TaxID=60249 RepID=UPI0038FC41DE
MAEERVNEHTPPVFSFTDEETLSANRENTRGASSSLGTYPTISDDAWRYHWNTQPRPITDRTYSVDGVSEYGSTSYVHQPFSTSIDYATPSTSLTDMEQASAIVEGGARIFQSTRVDQWNTQYLTADVRSTDCGHVHIAESGITSSLPMVSSSSINHAQPSTSRACMEKASAIPENLASISDDAWLYQWNTQQRRITDWTYNVDGVTDKGNTSYLHLGSSTSIDHAMSIISRTGMEQAPAITESGARIPETTRVDLWNTQYHLADSTSTDCGHTGHTEIGSTDFTLPVCSSSPVARTSYARLQEPSDIFGNYAWNATGTGGREQQEFCGACSNVSSRQDALHGHTKERTGDTAYTCKASEPVNNSVNHCRNTTGTNHKCVTCGKMFHRASLLATHYRTHTNERPYKCEICEKSFRQSHHRDMHKRTHTGERPCTCKTCGKSFAKSWNLRTHNYTHTDEKPHVCQKSKPEKTSNITTCVVGTELSFAKYVMHPSRTTRLSIVTVEATCMDETPY